jgi:hypothetical protein
VIANGIAREFRIGRMCGSIDLQNEARLVAGEIGDKGTQNDLSTEFEAADLLAPQARPQA